MSSPIETNDQCSNADEKRDGRQNDGTKESSNRLVGDHLNGANTMTSPVHHWLWGHSIRRELIGSQLLLITLIVVGFGGTIFWVVLHGTYRQAEADLLGAAQLLAQELRAPNEPSSLTISQAYRHRFGPAPRDHAYFSVWDQNGQKIAGSDPIPPHARALDHLPPIDGPRPYVSRPHGSHLDVIVRGPNNEQILIGRPLAKEFDRLQTLFVTICFFGLLSVVIGAMGAWWLARKIIQPLEQMTQTAEQISFRHLDQRLGMTSSSNEVSRLATVFNTMLDRLQKSFEQQARFTADASHELRTPVAVILTQAEHSLSRPRTPVEYCAALETCVVAATQMKRLIDDLLILARADLGRLQLRHAPLDLAEVVRDVLMLLEPLAEQRKVRLSSHLLSAGVDGDSLRLNQVVTNLVSNAIRYNRPEGSVSVSVFARDGRSWLVVADSGIGIPLGDQSRVIERFFRADTSRTFDDNQGTGLGLSIADEIISAHGGTMEIASQPDRGTTVTVQVPASDVSAADVPVPPNGLSPR
jgi:two-component system OmpR family sensor kinase